MSTRTRGFASVNDVDGSILVVAVGVLATWIGATDAMLRYLRPSMRPWLVLAGVVLLVLGTVDYLHIRRQRSSLGDHDPHGDHAGHEEHGEHGVGDSYSFGQGDDDGEASGEGHAGHDHGRSRVGWLLLLPVVIAVLIDPGALGAYAVTRQSNLRFIGASDFELEPYLRSHSFGGAVPDLLIAEFMAASRNPDDQELLAATEVKLIGFVVNGEGPEGSFLVARLQIGCCAADALAATVEVHGWEATYPDESWVEVTGTFDLATTLNENEDAGWFVSPILVASAVREIEAPKEKYEYPR